MCLHRQLWRWCLYMWNWLWGVTNICPDGTADGNTVHWRVLFVGTTNSKPHTHGILCAFGNDFRYQQKFKIRYKIFNISLLIATMWLYRCLQGTRLIWEAKMWHFLRKLCTFKACSRNWEKATIPLSPCHVCLSVRLYSCNNSAPTRGIFMKFYI